MGVHPTPLGSVELLCGSVFYKRTSHSGVENENTDPEWVNCYCNLIYQFAPTTPERSNFAIINSLIFKYIVNMSLVAKRELFSAKLNHNSATPL